MVRMFAIPVYSHEIYDIVPGQKQRVEAADFVIVGESMFSKILIMPVSILLISLTFQSMSMPLSKTLKVGYLDRFLKLLSFAQDDQATTTTVSLNFLLAK